MKCYYSRRTIVLFFMILLIIAQLLFATYRVKAAKDKEYDKGFYFSSKLLNNTENIHNVNDDKISIDVYNYDSNNVSDQKIGYYISVIDSNGVDVTSTTRIIIDGKLNNDGMIMLGTKNNHKAISTIVIEDIKGKYTIQAISNFPEKHILSGKFSFK